MKNDKTLVFVALGGNIGNTKKVFIDCLNLIKNIPEVFNLQCSTFHVTKAVSTIVQRDYLNAVCRFWTTLSARDIFKELQKVERSLGKVPKDKESPRIIDLDLIFYGEEILYDEELDLTIPHPRWKERSFVLIPLQELLGTTPMNPH